MPEPREEAAMLVGVCGWKAQGCQQEAPGTCLRTGRRKKEEEVEGNRGEKEWDTGAQLRFKSAFSWGKSQAKQCRTTQFSLEMWWKPSDERELLNQDRLLTLFCRCAWSSGAMEPMCILTEQKETADHHLQWRARLLFAADFPTWHYSVKRRGAKAGSTEAKAWALDWMCARLWYYSYVKIPERYFEYLRAQK